MPRFPVEVDANSPFPLQNIPFGIFSESVNPVKRAGTVIGQWILDLALLERHGIFSQILPTSASFFNQDSLNAFAVLPWDVRRKTREIIISNLSSNDSHLFADPDLSDKAFLPLHNAQLHVPMKIPAFTDFSCFEEHVGNCFAMSNFKFGPESNFYKSLMAYNGRTSSIIPTNVDFARPQGVFKNPSTGLVEFQPTRKLDYEMEMGILLSTPLPFGQLINADEATDHIFGFVLLNDWSARDIQMYESMPAGPFNCKAFASSVSTWVIVPEALLAAQTAPFNQDKDSVPVHARHSNLEKTSYDISFNVYLGRSGEKGAKISTSNLKHSYFTPGQCIAHRASSGCGLETGELIGGGTISSPESHWPDRSVARNGCLFEITWDGTREVPQTGGTWVEDGDEVTMEAWAEGLNGVKIGFGQLTTKILPAIEMPKVNGN